jgi:hypothetical protein
MTIPIDVDAQGLRVTASLCIRMVDEASLAGYERKHMRWRVSPSQRRCILRFVTESCSAATMDTIVARGGDETGTWVGVPYIVDPDISNTGIVLEVVSPGVPVGILRGLSELVNG